MQAGRDPGGEWQAANCEPQTSAPGPSTRLMPQSAPPLQGGAGPLAPPLGLPLRGQVSPAPTASASVSNDRSPRPSPTLDPGLLIKIRVSLLCVLCYKPWPGPWNPEQPEARAEAGREGPPAAGVLGSPSLVPVRMARDTEGYRGMPVTVTRTDVQDGRADKSVGPTVRAVRWHCPRPNPGQVQGKGAGREAGEIEKTRDS